jgi:uncharacterized protein (TIRG00374 family)
MKKFITFTGFLLGGFFLIYACWQVKWSEFINSIANIKVAWVLMMAATFALSMFLRSIRWQIITRLPWSYMAKVWEATCIGYLGTAIYPAKAGDVLKVMRLQKITGIGAIKAIISAIFDRVLDGLALCVLLGILLAAWGRQFNLTLGIWIIAGVFLLLFLIITFYCAGGHRLKSFFSWIAAKGAAGKWLNRLYQQSLAGVHLLELSKIIIPCLLIQVFITIFDVLACWLLFCAFGWKLSLLPAVVMLVYLAAAFCLPSTPGYVGVYQVASIFALGLFGINESEAVAYGTIFQAIAFILFAGVGLQAQFGKSRRLGFG